MLAVLGFSIVAGTVCCIEPLSAEEAVTAYLTDPSVSVSGSQVMSPQTLQSVPSLSANTFINGLYRYLYPPPTILLPSTGIKMDEKVALATDAFVMFWWSISGAIVGDTWIVNYYLPNGTLHVSTGWRIVLVDVNGQPTSCFEAFNVQTGQLTDRFCGSLDGLGLGMYVRGKNLPFGTYRLEFLYNETLLHTDQFFLANVALVNPNPAAPTAPLVDEQGRIITDIEQLASNGLDPYAVQAAATDGVTPLLLLVGTVPDVPVTVRVGSGSTEDGTLQSLDGLQGPDVVVTPDLHVGADGKAVTGVRYTVPSEFSNGVTLIYSRPITLETSFQLPWQPAPAVLSAPLTLIRPPVILIHGIWSDPSAWDALKQAPAFSTTHDFARVNWSPGASHLDAQNLARVETTVMGVLQTLRSRSVAVTQVDVVGHSAGGLLARLWAQSASYRRNTNFMSGDFRKLITIGTPHQGSEVATLVLQLAPLNTLKALIVKWYFENQDSPLVDGVVDDLAPESGVITSLRTTPVRSRAWAGDASSLPPGSRLLKMWEVLASLCSSPSGQGILSCQGIRGLEDALVLRSRMFLNQANDGVVSQPSQLGGLQYSAQGFLTDTMHIEETAAAQFLNDLPSFLDSTMGFDEVGFPSN